MMWLSNSLDLNFLHLAFISLVIGLGTGRFLPIRWSLIVTAGIALWLLYGTWSHYAPPGHPDHDGQVELQLFVWLIALPVFIAWSLGIYAGYWLQCRSARRAKRKTGSGTSDPNLPKS